MSMPENRAARRPGTGQTLLAGACAALAGFVAGRPLAESGGLVSAEYAGQSIDRLGGGQVFLVFFGMLLCALFVFGLVRFLFILGRQTVAVLAHVQARPPVWMGAVAIGAGVVCVLGAIALQWQVSAAGARLTANVAVPGASPFNSRTTAFFETRSFQPAPANPAFPIPGVVGGNISVGTHMPLLSSSTTLLVLVIGAALMAVGIWCTIPTMPAAGVYAGPPPAATPAVPNVIPPA